MFEQQQRVELSVVFNSQFRCFLDSERRFIIDAAQMLDQKPFSLHYSWHGCNQIVIFERHSNSRVGLWYNHPSTET